MCDKKDLINMSVAKPPMLPIPVIISGHYTSKKRNTAVVVAFATWNKKRGKKE